MNYRVCSAPLVVGACLLLAGPGWADENDKVSEWQGYQRREFVVDGRNCLLIVPKAAAAGQPWIWRTEFFGHEPQADLALLGKGFHVAYMDVQNMYGAPVALDHMDQFYKHLTETRGLSKKTVLEGFSRGGLFALNWGARHPDQVACIYNDAPVCDFKSWPGGRGKGPGSPGDWERCLKAYKLTEAEGLEYKFNPVDNLAPLAKGKVPLLHVCGDADEVVPFAENSELLAKRYKELGGDITLIVKPGVKHHPHSLKDPAPIVAFVLKHTLGESGVKLMLSSPKPWQVVQRQSPKSGMLRVAGAVQLTSPDAPQPDKLIVDIGQPAGLGAADIAYDPRAPKFQGQVEVPAGGWYRITVRATLQGVTLAETSVENVGMGDVFVIAGQSNSANHGEERQTTQSKMVTTFDGNAWRVANDPQPGASGSSGSFAPAFGDALYKSTGVPVGIVATGVGATSVREWLPRGTRIANLPTLTGHVVTVGPNTWECDGELFHNLVQRMQSLGPQGFRAVLWHQGESDANQRDAGRTLSEQHYREYLAQLITDSRKAVGWNVPWFVAQASYHTPDDAGSAEIRAAQAAIWKSGLAFEGPDTDALIGKLRDSNGQGVHFSAAGLQRHGELWAEKVGNWLQSPSK